MNLPTRRKGTLLSSNKRRTWRRLTPNRSASWSLPWTGPQDTILNRRVAPPPEPEQGELL